MRPSHGYGAADGADEAAAGEGGAGGPTELSVARATPCAAICEASARLFARPHISARGGHRDAAARYKRRARLEVWVVQVL